MRGIGGKAEKLEMSVFPAKNAAHEAHPYAGVVNARFSVCYNKKICLPADYQVFAFQLIYSIKNPVTRKWELVGEAYQDGIFELRNGDFILAMTPVKGDLKSFTADCTFR